MKEEWQQMIDDCDARESRLNEWEIVFIRSIDSQLYGGGSLSPKHVGILERIWEKVTEKG